MSEHIPAPLFCITVRVFAWTEKQAARVKAQVEGMFAGAEVSIVDNAPAPVPPPLPAPEVAAPVAEVPPPALAIEAPPPRIVPEGSPVKFDQTLLDVHSKAIVTVTDINPTSFVWRNDAADVAENARNGICPFANFEGNYEILPDGAPAAAAAAEPEAEAPEIAPDPSEHKPAAVHRAKHAAHAKHQAAKHARKAHK